MTELVNPDGPEREEVHSLRAYPSSSSAGAEGSLPKQEAESTCTRQIDPKTYRKLIDERRALMKLSSDSLDDLPEDLTKILGKESIDPDDSASSGKEEFNPSKEDITGVATELCRDRISSLLSDPAFNSQFGATWRGPLKLNLDDPIPAEFIEAYALGIRTLISVVRENGRTPKNSRSFEYGWPTKRYEPAIEKHISEATHIGPESWHMGQFLFGGELLRETLYYLALSESCENASQLQPHRFRAKRDQGQLSLIKTSGNLAARKSLQTELVRDLGLDGLGTAIAAEAQSEKIPIYGSQDGLRNAKEYTLFIDYARELIEAHKEDFPDFARLPAKAWDRAFGFGAVEFGMVYRQIRSANKQILRSVNPTSRQAIHIINNARDFLVNTSQGIIQAVTIDKADNAVSISRYLEDSYLRERVNGDLSLARASIIAQSGRVLLAAQTIRDCIKMYPESMRKPFSKACDLLVDLLYTAVETDVNPVLRASGLPAIGANETYSAYRKISKPLQNKIEELYGDKVDKRMAEVLESAFSGDLYITCILNIRPPRIQDRPIH